ncbi:MAG: glycosyltransferase [Flavobacteriaceae bacterium]|nr:glycosyltransferase [Flavobacteriaceae bacterium]
MQNKNKKKICLVVSSLGRGGAERSAGLLSKALSNSGYDVHIVTILNDISFDYAGQVFNLGKLKERNDSFIGRIWRMITFRSFLKKHRFDYIIDSRTRVSVRKQRFISRWLYGSTPVIYIVRSHNLRPYFGGNKAKARQLYAKAYKIVAVSEAIETKIRREYGFENVISIPNPVELKNSLTADKPPPRTRQYILFYGRLVDRIKNISMLLEAYTKSDLPKEGIKLIILGDGPDKEMLKKKAEDLVFADLIEFIGFRKNPFSHVRNARFTVLTSRYEGFPRSLIESLALGTPVISTAYEGGCEAIVSHEENGLIVPSNDINALAQAMNSFIFDKALYETCKSNARSSVSHISIDSIGRQWAELLK